MFDKDHHQSPYGGEIALGAIHDNTSPTNFELLLIFAPINVTHSLGPTL